MTNAQVLDLYRGLNSCGNLTGEKFTFFVAKNIKKMQPEIEVIQEEIKKVQLEYCKKDKNGDPVIKDEKYEMENLDAFDKVYKNLMNIENPIETFKIKNEDIPANITASQKVGIFDLIIE